MIPDFPEFKKVEMSDKEIIDSYAIKYGGYSDFVFSNVWTWDLESKCKISKLNNNLVFWFTDYYSNESFLSFMGDKKVQKTAVTLLKFSEEQNISNFLSYIPEHIANKLSADPAFLILEKRDNFDYVYGIENMSKYEGGDFKSKRILYNRFLRENSNVAFKEESLDKPEIQFELRKIMQKSKRCKEGDAKCYYLDLEAKVFERTLKIQSELNLILTCTYVDNTMVSFSLDELLEEAMCLSHIFKVDYSYKGLYEYHNAELAKFLLQKKMTRWNWVEDLGISNLRKSKMSYRPELLLKTYNVSLV